VAELEIRALNPAVGAEVEGLEPVWPLDEDTLAQLRSAFDQRGVLVFRDLDVDETFQRRLVYGLIGEEAPEEEKRTQLVSNREPGGAAPYGRLLYHCDMMWAERPEPVVSLYGAEVEQPSVPTAFVSMAHGWATLPNDLRQRIEGLEARHGHEHYYPNRGGDDDVIDSYYEDAHASVKPIPFLHPRTGVPLLYVSQQVTMEVLGLDHDANEALLEEIFEHLYQPNHVALHQWRTGDLVIWDNIAVQHARGTVDLEGPARTLRKVTGPIYVSAEERKAPTFSKVPGA
jgi:alpha-ketoglutarate-dependent taurine dioxygenase